MEPPAHHSQHTNPWLNAALWGTGGVIAAPYVLPAIGIGDEGMTNQILNLCSSGGQEGLAAATNQWLADIHPSLAAGDFSNALISGALGIGGVLLGNYVHKHYDKHGGIPWGRIIKYAAITTSILIALPSILSSVTMGLSYISFALGGAAFASSVAGVLSESLGFIGSTSAASAGAGLTGLLAHVLTCGVAALPVIGSVMMDKKMQHAPQTGQSASYSARMVATPRPSPNQPCEIAFQLIDNETGRPLTEDELETMNTQKLHSMIVDSSLRDYHHIHPTYDPARQLFTCNFTPSTSLPYALWNDFTVKGEAAPSHCKTGIGNASGFTIPARIALSSHSESENLHADISNERPLCAGESATVRIHLRDADDKPVTNLEPIMGSLAHLAAFSADGKHFIHTHPLNENRAGALEFHLTPPVSGGVKFFLQVQRNGRVVTLPFGQQVLPSPTFSTRMMSEPSPHMAHAMA